MLTVIFQLIYPHLGVISSHRWFFIDEYIQSLAVANDVINVCLNFVLNKMNMVTWDRDKKTLNNTC